MGEERHRDSPDVAPLTRVPGKVCVLTLPLTFPRVCQAFIRALFKQTLATENTFSQ